MSKRSKARIHVWTQHSFQETAIYHLQRDEWWLYYKPLIIWYNRRVDDSSLQTSAEGARIEAGAEINDRHFMFEVSVFGDSRGSG